VRVPYRKVWDKKLPQSVRECSLEVLPPMFPLRLNKMIILFNDPAAASAPICTKPNAYVRSLLFRENLAAADIYTRSGGLR